MADHSHFMPTARRLAAAAACGLAAMAASPAQAGLAGLSFTGPSAFSSPSFVVGPGVETGFVGIRLFTFEFDFSDTGLQISFSTIASPTFVFAFFPSTTPTFVFTATAPLGITGVTPVGTAPEGFGAANITASGSDISVSFANVTFSFDPVTGASTTGPFGATFSFAAPPPPSPVPEPASMALLGAGLLGLAAARRRRA